MINIDGDSFAYTIACRPNITVEDIPLASKNLLNSWKRKVGKLVDNTDRMLYLSEPSIELNFRKVMNPAYKEQRSPHERPELYDEVREYIKNSLPHVMAPAHLEADDLLSIHGGEGTVTVGIDKDAWQVPGWHYDVYRGRNRLFYADKTGYLRLYYDKMNSNPKLLGTGFRWFCAQMLIGDKVDNIIGVEGVGNVAALKLLSQESDHKKLWDIVTDQYCKAGNPDQLMNAHMLWMLREYDEHFDEGKI